MIPFPRALKFAEKVVDQLRPHCVRIEIAGSIRRRRPEVDDVDLVIEARDRRAIEAILTARCTTEKSGEQNLVAITREKGVKLDLWFSYRPQPHQEVAFFPSQPAKPDNFGTLLLARTGSKEHNIVLAERAKRLGLHWNPHWGVYQQNACIASVTEDDIYRALGLDYMEPENREFCGRADQLRTIHAGRTR